MNTPFQWYELIDHADTVTSLYTLVPSLNQIKLNGIYASHNPDIISLHFNLARFPDRIPESWLKYNTVYISIDFTSLVSIQIFGWQVGETAHIEMKQTEKNLISCEIISISCTAHILAAHGEIAHIGAYLQSPNAEW
jgi:hypothetical protein